MVTKLKLGPLPRQDSAKLTLNLPAALKEDLERYAVAHSELYGEQVDAAALIPHMLAHFLTKDRGFKRRRQG